MTDLVLGVDEAGRGPILGPLVMACVGLAPRRSAALTRAGVMDSKKFGAGHEAHAARSRLVPLILDAAAHAEVAVIDVHEVDRRCVRGELNKLEQERAHRLLVAAPVARRIVADGARMFGPLRAHFPHLDAVDHGESEHVAVAAASVLAKVRRDELFLAILRRYEPAFGSFGGWGYTNAATHRFLCAYIERHGGPPPEARRSWPWDFAADLLGDGWDPLAGFADLGRPQRQLAL